MKALGLSPEDYDNEPPLNIYEDCWDSLNAFISLSTQWRYASAGMAGLFQTGLEYTAIPVVLDLIGAKDRQQVFLDLRVMESTALDIFAKQRKQNVV